MTTINSYSVSLALDASSYIRNSSLSRKETQSLVREINSARTPAENYERKLGLLNKALKEGAVDLATYNRLVRSVGQGTQVAADQTNMMAVGIKKLVPILAGFQAANTLKGMINLGAEAESAGMAFEVLTGSAGDARDLITGLRDLAAKTPLQLSDTQSAARTMLSFSVATQDILPTLKMLGDVTGGNADRFKMMTLAYSQMAAAGRMMGQDLLQMINSGFNPLQEISRKTGESLVDLKKRMEDGAISSQEVAEAFKTATAEGGKFFGMIDRMATTTEGKMAKLTDQVKSLAREIGEALAGPLNDIMDVASGVAGSAGGLRINERFSVGYGALKAMASDVWGARGNPFSREGMSTPGNLRSFLEERFNPRLMSRPQDGYTPPWFNEKAAGEALANSGKDYTASHAIESAITKSIESLKTGAGGIMDAMRTFQDTAVGISMAGMAQTQELAKELKNDPAVQNLQVGTQQAYEYMTKASRDMEKQAALESQRKRQLDENAKAQREKMNQYLDRINTALENNGWKRIR